MGFSIQVQNEMLLSYEACDGAFSCIQLALTYALYACTISRQLQKCRKTLGTEVAS